MASLWLLSSVLQHRRTLVQYVWRITQLVIWLVLPDHSVGFSLVSAAKL